MTDTKAPSEEEEPEKETATSPEAEATRSEDPAGEVSGPGEDTGSETAGEDPEAAAPEVDRVGELEAEVAALKERYLRAVADLENYRRRALREKEELRTLAVANFFENLLTPLDNFRLGLEDAAKREEASGIVGGFQMVYDQISSAVTGVGIEILTPGPGEPFDPNHHDCVAHQPSEEHPEGHVTVTARPGYRLRERLIRPASVVVSSGATTEESTPPNAGDDS